MQYIVRLHIDPDTDKRRGMAVWNPFCCGCCYFILFYNKIFAVTFDENFARATGTRANAYNLLIAVVIAVIIVLAMNLVGSLLISALVIFPALSAMRLFKSFRSVTISAAVLSVLSATAGILISILAGTPVGLHDRGSGYCCISDFLWHWKDYGKIKISQPELDPRLRQYLKYWFMNRKLL